ncbi:hypothetical protein B0H14DRAFT_3032799, partial [Mycena olivaceomarginata]
ATRLGRGYRGLSHLFLTSPVDAAFPARYLSALYGYLAAVCQSATSSPPFTPCAFVWMQSCSSPQQHTKSGVYYHHPQKHTPCSYPSFRLAAPSNSVPPGQVPTSLDWDHDPRLR